MTALGWQPGEFEMAMMQQAGLTTEEARLLWFELYAWWQFRVQTIAYVDELPPGERTEFDEALRRNYGLYPVDRIWYETAKRLNGVLNPDAIRYIDNLLAQPG